MKKLIIYFLGFISIMLPGMAMAQATSPLACSGNISSFPYTENFENTDGNWVSGGTLADWEWGMPSKPVISSAGGGNKCWVTGGLVNSFYNNGENSWLQSPCFDFSALQFPEISFKVLWETEKKFDGASFQYSLDGGNTWQLLGSINSNSNCEGENWFNTPGITYLGNVPGWSGNIQSTSGSCQGGGGSSTWLTARHSLTNLAGQGSVRFRFIFGAGTTCNAYDGFAIDDILIHEAAPNSASFTSSCVDNKIVAFDGTAGCATAYSWNFGDPGSGTANLSTLPNPSHSFSAPGSYTVSLSVQYANGPSASSTKTIVIIGVTGSQVWPGSCTGASDATLSVTASGSSTGYFYSWNTTPPQTTSSITNVGPGAYMVTVSAMDACANVLGFSLNASTAIVISTSTTAEKCNNKNGSASATVSGGVAPLQYTWSSGATTATASNLVAGNYSLTVADANGCSATKNNIVVPEVNIIVKPDLGKDLSICTGQSIILQAGSYSGYLWQDNTVAPTYTAKAAGLYYIMVTDASGCKGSDTLKITENCSGIYFPSAFTPNGDGRNDGFGPLGNLSAITKYKCLIYNRYGQLVFSSSNPLEKWKGKFQDMAQNTSSFTWFATYLYNGQPGLQKGMVTLLR
ncbi:MAG: gliding motility-associated C-terminal domain-containing protein [Ferruginibacter sp.]